MDIFYNKLEADPSTIGMDVVGGRLDLVSATSIRWSFLNSNQIRLVNPDTGRWELVKCSAEPQLLNTTNDLNGTALAPNTIYDVFAEYDSSTAFDLVLSRWATGGDGANNSSTSYATPVMTANNAPGPVVITSSGETSIYYAYLAFHQNPATDNYISNALPSSGSPKSLMVDFGQPICINKYLIYAPASGNLPRFPVSWMLQGSNSSVTVDNDGGWETLDIRNNFTVPSAASWTPNITFVNNKSYRYYRMRVTAVNGAVDYWQISQLKLVAAPTSLPGSSTRIAAYESTVTYAIGDRVTYGGHDWVKQSSAAANTTPVAGNDWVDNGLLSGGHGDKNNSTAYATPIMTSASAPSGTVTYTSQYDSSGNAAWNAFNQNSSDSGRWASSATPTAQSPQVLMYDYGSSLSKIVNKYQLQSYNHSDADIRAFPKAWTLEATNGSGVYSDASGTNGWVVLDTRSATSDPGQVAWGTYTFYNATAYQKYRIVITDRNGISAYVSIDNLKLVESQDDFTGLYRHNGVLVSDSSTTGKSRRWLGIIYTYNNSGTVNFKDDVNYRYISNWYNRKQLRGLAYNTNANWSADSLSVWRESNNGSGAQRCFVVLCDSTTIGVQPYGRILQPVTGQVCYVAAGANTTSTRLSSFCQFPNINSVYLALSGQNYTYQASAGLNWFAFLEFSPSSVTYYSDTGNSGGVVVSGIQG